MTATEAASGKVNKPYGENPKGYLVYTKGGRAPYFFVADNRATPASAAVTDAEAVALFRTLAAGSGTYKGRGQDPYRDLGHVLATDVDRYNTEAMRRNRRQQADDYFRPRENQRNRPRRRVHQHTGEGRIAPRSVRADASRTGMVQKKQGSATRNKGRGKALPEGSGHGEPKTSVLIPGEVGMDVRGQAKIPNLTKDCRWSDASRL